MNFAAARFVPLTLNERSMYRDMLAAFLFALLQLYFSSLINESGGMKHFVFTCYDNLYFFSIYLTGEDMIYFLYFTDYFSYKRHNKLQKLNALFSENKIPLLSSNRSP